MLKRLMPAKIIKRTLTWRLLAFFALLACSAVVFGFRSNPTLQGNAPSQRMEVELVTALPGGLQPSEITRPMGRFVLAVDNRSGMDDLSLQLNREAGSSVREVKFPKRKSRWHEAVDLPPGQYVLTEANHPQWRCQINITPN